MKLKPIYHSPIPVLIGRRYNTDTLNAKERRRISSNVIRLDVVRKSVVEKLQNRDKVPALFALNAVALTKPHAVHRAGLGIWRPPQTQLVRIVHVCDVMEYGR